MPLWKKGAVAEKEKGGGEKKSVEVVARQVFHFLSIDDVKAMLNHVFTVAEERETIRRYREEYGNKGYLETRISNIPVRKIILDNYNKMILVDEIRAVDVDELRRDHRKLRELVDRINAALAKMFFELESSRIEEFRYEELGKHLAQRLSDYLEIDDRGFIYLIAREVFGYGILDPFIEDRTVEDIQLLRINTPVKVLAKGLKGGSKVYVTNAVIRSKAELDALVEKLVHMSGHSISYFVPYASIRLPRGHRLTVAYKTQITTHGSLIIIRKHPEEPWSITRLFRLLSLAPEMAAWLYILISNKRSIIVGGPMGSGKTSVINAVSSFIPSHSTIVTIEDTPELRLPHRYWIQHVTRETMTVAGTGRIGMFELLKLSLRESADYVIVGEIRGEEARIWAQAIALGHGGITSFHGDSPKAIIMRLITEPMNVDVGMLSELYGITMNESFLLRDESGRLMRVRKTFGLYDVEIVGYDKETLKRNITRVYRKIVEYFPEHDTNRWVVRYGEEEAGRYLHETGKLLEWLSKPTARSRLMEKMMFLAETHAGKAIMAKKGYTRPTHFVEEYLEHLEFFAYLNAVVLAYDHKLDELRRDNPVQAEELQNIYDEVFLRHDNVTRLIWSYQAAPDKIRGLIRDIYGNVAAGAQLRDFFEEAKRLSGELEAWGESL